MKKIIFPLLAMMTLTGCNSWIEESPDGLITDTKVGDSPEAMNQWLTGAYSKWIDDMFRWGYFPKVLEFDADYISGPDWLFGTFGAGNFQGESSVTDALWKGCYGLIERCNNAERHIDAMLNVSQEAKDNAIGELRFQKALAYFLLVRAYGEVPIQGEGEDAEDCCPRESVGKVYDYITRNLESATTLMYSRNNPSWQQGHASAGTAAGLLAKVYATMAAAALPEGTALTIRTGKAYDESGDGKTYAPLQSITMHKTVVKGYEGMDSKALYAKAAEWAAKVVGGEYGTYELLPYDQLWKKASAGESEHMFYVASVSGDATYKNSVHEQYEGYFTEAGSDFLQSGGWVGCTRHWYDLFEHDDLRITKGVKHRWRYHFHRESNSGFYYPLTKEYTRLATGYDADTDSWGQPSGVYADGVSYYYSMDSQCLAFTTKYDDVTDRAITNADSNWPLLRYADVLLIYAEALNELGRADEAVQYLNRVRTRSNASPATLSGQGALDTPLKLRSAIIEERAKELACEADRRWDLIRWGVYLEAMNALGGSDDAGVNKSRQPRNLLYPLPAEEINTNRNINENNPGWN